MEFVFVTDTHLGLKQHNQFWADLTVKLFDDIIDYCIKKDIHDVIHLGDFFDSRKILSVLTIHTANLICNKFQKNKINLHLIRGNHDTFYNDQIHPHSLSFLENDYINIIDENLKQIDNLTLVPWGYDISKIKQKEILLGHFEINGFITNSSGFEYKGGKINKSDFKKFKQVYSGHFHTYSKQDNIIYLGNPFATTFNDINQKKGYYLFKDKKLKFIEFKDAPKFYRIYSNEKLEDFNIDGNIIDFVFVEDYGNVKSEKLLNKLYSLNPCKLYTNYDINDNEEIEIDNINVCSNSEIIREYIDKKELPEHLNKNVVLKFVEKLENE